MSSDKETDDADKEICELLDPTKIAELELSKKAEMDSDVSRRPERKRNIVKRQISFNKKAAYRYVPLGSQDSKQNLESGTSAATRQDPFKILICQRSGKQSEVDLNSLITITSNRFSCRFKAVIDNIFQTWKNICDLHPALDETISAFRILSPQSSNLISQKVSEDTNENSENPLSDGNVENKDLKEILKNISLETVDDDEKDSDSLSLTFEKVDVSERAFSADTVKKMLDLPRRKLYEKSSEIENLIEAKSFNQIFISINACQDSSVKVARKKCSSTITSTSLTDTEIQSSTTAKVETHPQKDEKVSESPTEKVHVRGISISSPFGQILSDALAKLDKKSSQAEPLFQSLIDNLFVLPYPGDHASAEATIKAIEYNLNHRLLQFHKDVPKLQRNVVNFFNRIECLVRKWPLNTSIRTLKQYLAFVLDVNSKIIKLNLLSLKFKFSIESERLISLSRRSFEKNKNTDYSFDLYKKYYLAVKYISALEELRGLSEKFYSYIVKPLPSFLV